MADKLQPGKLSGSLDAAGLRFGIAVSRFNSFITERLLSAAVDALERSGAKSKDVDVVHVPGSFELPLTAKKMRLDVILDGYLYNQTSSTSPLVNRVDGLKQKQDGVATYEVWLPRSCDYNQWGSCLDHPPDSVAVVVLQQRLTLYSSLFYGLPAPTDFTGVPA